MIIISKVANYKTATNTRNHEKINLISGAYTLPFVDTLNAVTNKDINTLMMIIALLTRLANKSDDETALEVIKVLYSVNGLIFPEEINLLCRNPHARESFIISFIQDLRDIWLDEIHKPIND